MLRTRLVVCTLVLLAAAAGAQAQGIVFVSQPPDLSPRGFDYSSDQSLPGIVGGWSLVADDFVCTVADPITDIHWWGSYWQPPYATPASDYWNDPSLSGGVPVLPPVVSAFVITIYDDVPIASDPLSTTMPFGHPGNILYTTTLQIADINVTLAGVIDRTGNTVIGDTGDEAVWRYDADLATVFQQTPGTRYWLSIQAVTENESSIQWGWHGADGLVDNNAVQAGPAAAWGTPYVTEWVLMPDKDMAFELTIPEPMTAGLLGAGFAALILLRKSRF